LYQLPTAFLEKSNISQLAEKFPDDTEAEISSQRLQNSAINRHQEQESLDVTFI